MFYLFLALFAAASVAHLACCFCEKEYARALTKPLLMPLLAFTVTARLMPGLPAARATLALIIIALAFGWLGDVLLIKTESEKQFLAGAAAFLVGHFFWMAQHAAHLAALPLRVFAVAVPCYAAVIALLYVAVGKPKGVMGAGIVAYGVVLCALNLTGIAALCAERSAAALLFLLGSIFFIVSDSILGRATLKADFPRSSFHVMLTYIIAQTLLAYGSAMAVG